ncbi:hypothetical protein NPIL_91691 [Nephila pilipes]|uniref:Uncharacterized protein n=1 Tax=Nephila pilipes TaxID=299642 RepID=A0A8X6TQN7_NEPPI|nr:hypothetical protein NPIL_91691 [Nephila pilipes]
MGSLMSLSNSPPPGKRQLLPKKGEGQIAARYLTLTWICWKRNKNQVGMSCPRCFFITTSTGFFFPVVSNWNFSECGWFKDDLFLVRKAFYLPKK